MLASQRALFDLPSDICYLNAASYGPLPLATVETARRGGAQEPPVADRPGLRHRPI